MCVPLTHTPQVGHRHDSGLPCVVGSQGTNCGGPSCPVTGVSRSTSVTSYRSPIQQHSTLTTVFVVIRPIWSSSTKGLSPLTSIIAKCSGGGDGGEVTLKLKGGGRTCKTQNSMAVQYWNRFWSPSSSEMEHSITGWLVTDVSKQCSGIIAKGQVPFKNFNMLNRIWQCRLYLSGSRLSAETDLRKLHFYTHTHTHTQLAISWPSVNAAQFLRGLHVPLSKFSILPNIYSTGWSFQKLFTS